MSKLKLVLPLIGLLVGMVPLGIATAQEDPTCDAYADIATICEATQAGEICYAAGDLTVDGAAELAEMGDTALISEVDALQSNGVTVLSVPVIEEAAAILTLFGNASITNEVGDLPDVLPTATVGNGAGYAVNMRGGPGTTNPVVGTFNWNQSATADGRNAAGDWVRLATDDGVAWISAGLLRFDEGSLDDLVIVEGNFTTPMQALTLETVDTDGACGNAGMLIEFEGEGTAQMRVNGVDLAFSTVTLLIDTAADADMAITVLDGDVEVTAAGETESATGGDEVMVAMDAQTASAAPTLNGAYRFTTVSSLPSGVVESDALACIAGVESAEIAGLNLPEDDGTTSLDLSPEAHYAITGWMETEVGVRWWQLTDGRDNGWVLASDIQMAGACSTVAEVDPTVAVTNTSSGGGSSSGGGGGSAASFVPVGQSVWQAYSGQDNMSGTCNSAPLVVCNHLVAINTNADGSISWRGQEPQPYTMYPAGDGFSFSGRNKLGNANITLFLRFTGESTWAMTMTQVFDSDPGCIHTFNYSATRNW